MNQFWEWTATDKFGKSRTYQTKGYDVCEATMLDFLRTAFPGATFSGIKRINPGETKPAIGPVEQHVYQFGIADAVRKELGLMPGAAPPPRPLISRNIIRPQSILLSRRTIRPS